MSNCKLLKRTAPGRAADCGGAFSAVPCGAHCGAGLMAAHLFNQRRGRQRAG